MKSQTKKIGFENLPCSNAEAIFGLARYFDISKLRISVLCLRGK